MISDLSAANQDTLNRSYDVCIAGAGAAGITLASALDDANLSICLLEAGDRTYSTRSQSFYDGPKRGHDYYELDKCRLRFLGGTTNHWAGWMRPLDPWDFEPKPHILRSGWPISYEDVDRFRAEACDIMGACDFDAETRAEDYGGNFTEVKIIQNPVRFAESHRAELENARNVQVLLNANLVGLDVDPVSGRILGARVRGYFADVQATIRSRHFVIAMGGIENARFLLQENRTHGDRLGNQGGHVGRYFSEHLEGEIGIYIVTNPSYSFTPLFRQMRIFCPTRAFIMSRQIANTQIRLLEPEAKGFSPFSNAPGRWGRQLRHDSDSCSMDTGTYCKRGQIGIAAEQVPNPRSQVFLSDELDRFGNPKAGLDWQLTELDRTTIRTMAVEVSKFLITHNIGRARLDDWLFDEGSEMPVRGGNHHMGTTRMAASAREGVVDPDCRVFGTTNLFAAGSSVFPTCGHANPTFTIVQLGLRLAEHLRTRA